MYVQISAFVGGHRKSYTMAVKAGVRIFLKPNPTISLHETQRAHGVKSAEVCRAVGASMTPLQTIEVETTDAAGILGPQASKSGQLKEGYDADFVGYSKSPLKDIDMLAHSEKVSHA